MSTNPNQHLDAADHTVADTLRSVPQGKADGSEGIPGQAANDGASGVSGDLPSRSSAANDDHVGVTPVVASAAADACPANDNVATDGPAPFGGAGSLFRSKTWNPGNPHEGGVILGLASERIGAVGAARQIADYLLSRAQIDGKIAGAGSTSSYRAICGAAGLALNALNIGTAARVLLDRWLPSMDVQFVLGQGLYAPNVGIVARVKEYCAALSATSLPMPATAGGKRVNVAAVAKAIGVDHEALKACRAAVRLLWDAVAQGLPLAVKSVPRRGKLENLARMEELMAVVRSFDVPGGKVPSSPHAISAPDYERIAELTGKPGHTLRTHPVYRKLLADVVANRGTMPPGLDVRSDTFATLLSWGSERIEAAQKAKGSVSWAAVLANHRSALDGFVNRLGLTLEDDATDAFGARFESNLAAASVGVGKSSSTANFVRLIRHWHELRLQRLSAVALPDRFGPALRQMLALRRVSASGLAIQVNCDRHTISDWCSEKVGVTTGRYPLIKRIEAVLKLSPGTLLDKVGGCRINVGPFDEASPEYLALHSSLRNLLPSGAAYWEVSDLEAALEKVRPLLSSGTSYTQVCRMSHAEENLLEPFRPSDRLTGEMERFLRYKTATVPYPLLRASKAQWMTDASSEMGMRKVAGIMRFASTASGASAFSGLGVSPALATMAWFAVPTMALSYVGHRAKRFADMECVNAGRIPGQRGGVKAGHC